MDDLSFFCWRLQVRPEGSKGFPLLNSCPPNFGNLGGWTNASTFDTSPTFARAPSNQKKSQCLEVNPWIATDQRRVSLSFSL